jgi:23S rRNA pseudouridine2605 synthase
MSRLHDPGQQTPEVEPSTDAEVEPSIDDEYPQLSLAEEEIEPPAEARFTHEPSDDPSASYEAVEPVRLAKLIAQRGLASRRKAEELIRGGEVSVNGVSVTEVATLVLPTDRIKVEGRRLPPEPKRVYYLMYKPRGMLTGEDVEEKGRPSLRKLLEELNLRVEPVGRLDFNSEGAVLLTNDGELAHKLSHPSSQVPKRFLVKCYRTPDARDIQLIERGVAFSDGTRSRPAKARVVDTTDKTNAWVEVTITESGQKVVQRILTQLGHPPSKVRRESYATISIRGMERGQIRPLTAQEVSRLRDIAAGIQPKNAGRKWRGEGFARARPKANRGPRKPRP